MEIQNLLPHLQECLRRWGHRPIRAAFESEYAEILNPMTSGFFDDFYEALMDVNWSQYRELALSLDPAQLEARLRSHIASVEAFLGFKLECQAFLLGTFETIDGYARFDRGTHQVFLGMDQEFASEKARDILIVHELVHVARESQPGIWTAWGLNPRMSQSEFVNSLPAIEHLAGEGFSCLISELLIPGQPLEQYGYLNELNFKRIQRNPSTLDHAIHSELKMKHPDYGDFYTLDPIFSHYVWAWMWMKDLYENRYMKNAKAMLSVPSKDWLDHALSFSLKGRI